MPEEKNEEIHKDQSKDSDYEELLDMICEEIDKLKALGIDPFPRLDFLECRACGAYEDAYPDGSRHVLLKDNNETEHEQVILIDSKERGYTKRNPSAGGQGVIVKHFKITYTFICPVCGAYQDQIIKQQFPLEY